MNLEADLNDVPSSNIQESLIPKFFDVEANLRLDAGISRSLESVNTTHYNSIYNQTQVSKKALWGYEQMGPGEWAPLEYEFLAEHEKKGQEHLQWQQPTRMAASTLKSKQKQSRVGLMNKEMGVLCLNKIQSLILRLPIDINEMFYNKTKIYSC